MQFRPDINDCEGLILAHSHGLAGNGLPREMTRTLIDAFIQNGFSNWFARPLIR